MNIVIIEDEKLTAEDLKKAILEVAPSSVIAATLYSVKQALEYFKENPEPDLIFSDIQLGDGLSFDIFNALNTSTPIIFCTAYDEYALNAFQLNGIDYLLKPFTSETVKKSLDKYADLSKIFSTDQNVWDEIQKTLSTINHTAEAGSILVNYKEKIIPIKMEDIALFYIENQGTYLTTFNEETYFLNKTLDQIGKICGPNFYRANRQFLINRKAIKNASHHLSRKFSIHLTIPFDQVITVSREKLSEFLDWLAQ